MAPGRSTQTCKRALRELEVRTDPAGASGNWSAEQDLCAGAEEAGLKKILRDGIMERKKSAPPYSEEHREAAREHNLIERMKK